VASLKVNLKNMPTLSQIEKHNGGLPEKDREENPDYLDPSIAYVDIMGVGRFPNGRTTKLNDNQIRGLYEHDQSNEDGLQLGEGFELKGELDEADDDAVNAEALPVVEEELPEEDLPIGEVDAATSKEQQK
jgi:hypothetical protein